MSVSQKVLNQLRDFIEGRLNVEEEKDIKEKIHASKELFHHYVELKEALFLKTTGPKANESLRKNVLKMISEKKSHVKIIVRVLKDKIVISGAEQAKADFQAVSATFAYRGKNGTGRILIERRIDGKEITIILDPVTDKEFAISLKMEPRKGIEVALTIDEIERETIQIEKQLMFDTRLSATGEADLVFYQASAELFSVNLQIQSEKE